MKKIILGLFLICIFSCKQKGLSDEEKKNLNFYIDLHNTRLQIRFIADSAEEVTKYKTKNREFIPTDSVDDYARTYMAVYSNEWNSPYDIKKDRHLTLDQYLHYCEAHNYDPVKYIDFIN